MNRAARSLPDVLAISRRRAIVRIERPCRANVVEATARTDKNAAAMRELHRSRVHYNGSRADARGLVAEPEERIKRCVLPFHERVEWMREVQEEFDRIHDEVLAELPRLFE